MGIAALHIAGKYEEIYPPELKNLLKVTDNAVSKQEIILRRGGAKYRIITAWEGGRAAEPTNRE